jgi:hypothetical protein
VNLLWRKAEDKNSENLKLVKALREEFPDFFSLCVELLFFEKKDVIFFIYRHVIAVRIVTFTIFSWNRNWSCIFFTFEANAGLYGDARTRFNSIQFLYFDSTLIF